MKRITVIIPVYNAEKNIAKCLDSIVFQLSEEDELLLIDDGSTDRSFSILCEYEKKYPFIRVIKQENAGVAKTRNLGIREAAGKYICFIDNDDYVDKDYFETFYEAIEQSKANLVMGGYRRVSDKGIKFSVKPAKGDWYKLMVVAPWSKIYRRQFLIDNQIEFWDYGIGEDIYFNFKVYAKTDEIKIIDYQGYNWWFNEQSISNTSQRGFQKQISIEHLLDQLIDITGSSKIYQYYYVRYIVWYLLFSGRNANKKEFMKEYHSGRKWLTEHNIPFRFPAFSNMFSGEKLTNRLSIKFFVIICKCKLVGCFARVYCKG